MSNESSLRKLYDDSVPFLTAHPDYDLTFLPAWVRDNISVARSYGGGLKGIILPDGRKYHLDNKLNDMTGRDWTFFINSVFTTHYPSRGKESYAHDIRKIHPTPKPPQLMRDLIQFFTKENEIVLDAFMGVGGTLLGASLAGRRAIGVDIEEKYLDAYKKAATSLGLQTQKTFCGDSAELFDKDREIDRALEGEMASLLLIDPPYANMMSRIKTGADMAVYGKKATPFTQKAADLGNMSRETFLASLKEIVEKTLRLIKTHGYVVVFSKDLQPVGKSNNLLHAEIVETLTKIDCLNYKGMKIWSDASAKFYPYGYPFSFVANQIHQYILIFRKEKTKTSRKTTRPLS